MLGVLGLRVEPIAGLTLESKCAMDEILELLEP